MSEFAELVGRMRGDRGLLRAQLLARPHEWLVDQLLAIATGDPGAVPDQRTDPSPGHQPRALPLDERSLARHTARLGAWDTSACLVAPCPPGPVIEPDRRTAQGEDLLRLAKDLLFAILFGGPAQGVRLERARRATITLGLPAGKAHVLAFLRQTITGDTVRIEFDEIASGAVADAVVAALRVINRLEINEEVLYARRADPLDSTMI
ncbi:hypothetical protein [Actinokineospora enzanensis]|uniref:hypothetical protein n=1 Tax=Actinokineospora enzanensis TaxID=155975 RepID=UPI00037BFFB9|nr:hypothetical protein [Actinokineospora enzanensis]